MPYHQPSKQHDPDSGKGALWIFGCIGAALLAVLVLIVTVMVGYREPRL